MLPHQDKKDVAKFLHCLSIIEKKVFELYGFLSEKIEQPLIKFLLLYVAYDSLKHSEILKGISETISPLEKKPGDCKERVGDLWKTVTDFYEEISKEEKLDKKELLSLANSLTNFEGVIGEEYVTIIQLRILEFTAKETPKIFSVESLKEIFERIVKDEERHSEILTMVKNLLIKQSETVKNQN
jgi:rubrerythrin